MPWVSLVRRQQEGIVGDEGHILRLIHVGVAELGKRDPRPHRRERGGVGHDLVHHPAAFAEAHVGADVGRNGGDGKYRQRPRPWRRGTRGPRTPERGTERTGGEKHKRFPVAHPVPRPSADAPRPQNVTVRLRRGSAAPAAAPTCFPAAAGGGRRTPQARRRRRASLDPLRAPEQELPALLELAQLAVNAHGALFLRQLLELVPHLSVVAVEIELGIAELDLHVAALV